MTTQIVQQRDHAKSAARETQTEIENKYQIAVAAVTQTTADSRQQIEIRYTNTLQTLDGREKEQLANVEELYARTGQKCRDIGVQVGDEAIAIGEVFARQWKLK